MTAKTTLRTGAWHGDKQIELEMPSDWEVKILSPKTPPPMTIEDMENKLRQWFEERSFRDIYKGKSRPVIIVDDLNRPTPVSQIMPSLLKHLRNEGVIKQNITILMATGAHGKPGQEAWLKKIGAEATSSCRLVIHDCSRDTKKVGVTSLGTPVYVNRAVTESDLVIGIGGIYPNHTSGFGGGSKLALGILGIHSIYHLHFRHKIAGWGAREINNSFRGELDEIASMIGMNNTISLMIDDCRNIIRMYCGNPGKYFQEAVDFYREAFCTAKPGDADVIISNTYPNDLSLTFASMKGFGPLEKCNSGASRIAIASCSEGMGLHNIFPLGKRRRLNQTQHIIRRLSIMSPGETVKKTLDVLNRKMKLRPQENPGYRIASEAGIGNLQNPIWLYRPGRQAIELSSSITGINITSSWSEILKAVYKEQGLRSNLRAVVYPCAFLQLLEDHN